MEFFEKLLIRAFVAKKNVATNARINQEFHKLGSLNGSFNGFFEERY